MAAYHGEKRRMWRLKLGDGQLNWWQKRSQQYKVVGPRGQRVGRERQTDRLLVGPLYHLSVVCLLDFPPKPGVCVSDTHLCRAVHLHWPEHTPIKFKSVHFSNAS